MSRASRNLVLLFSLLLLGSCQETYRLDFRLVMPADFDPALALDRIVISAGDQTRVVSCDGDGCPFDVKFTFPEGEMTRVSAHGYDADSRLVAAGYTPAFVAVDGGMELALFFAPVDRGSVIDTDFEAAPFSGVLEPLLTSEEDSLSANVGTLIFGGAAGTTADATPVDDVWFYDPYLLALIPLEPLSVPLANPAIMDLKDGNFLLFGGRTTGGEISGAMLFYSTSSVQAAGSHVITLPADTAPVPTVHSSTVELGPFDALYDSARGQYLLDAFLLLSGATGDGAEAPVTWVLIYYSLASATTTIVTRRSEMTLPAGVNAQAVRLGDTSVRVFLPEARRFLTAAVDNGEQGLEFRLEPVEVPELPVRGGWKLLALGDRLLALAGTDDRGGCAAGEWFDVDAVQMTVRPLELPPGHCESALVRMGRLVIEVGGVDRDHGLHGATAWTWELGDAGLRLTSRLDIPMARERTRPQVFVLPTGAIAVFGGKNAGTGETEPSLELIVPDPRRSQEPQ
jgi:hypothetical protein